MMMEQFFYYTRGENVWTDKHSWKFSKLFFAEMQIQNIEIRFYFVKKVLKSFLAHDFLFSSWKNSSFVLVEKFSYQF